MDFPGPGSFEKKLLSYPAGLQVKSKVLSKLKPFRAAKIKVINIHEYMGCLSLNVITFNNPTSRSNRMKAKERK